MQCSKVALFQRVHVDPTELRRSLSWAWFAVSLPLLLAIVLPLFAPASAIDRITPVCIWQSRFGRACPSCGLTTAFIRIGAGDWRGAHSANRFGIPLYTAFVLNSIFFLRLFIRRT